MTKQTNSDIEEWKKIPDFSKYSCSKSGQIRSDNTGRIITSHKDADGYLSVRIKKDTDKSHSVRVHRAVAMAWLPNPNNEPTVNHKNRIRDDNRLENLEWLSYSKQNSKENKNYPVISKRRKAVWKCDKETGEKIELYSSIEEAAKNNNIKSQSHITQCINGKVSHARGFKWIYDDKNYFNIKTQSSLGELWKSIDDTYYISNHGRFFNKKEKKLIDPYISNGYYCVTIGKKMHKIHRLVAKHFVDNPNNHEKVNHINGVKTDNKASNLEFCTISHNVRHAVKMQLNKKVIKIIQYNKSYDILQVYDSLADAARSLNRYSPDIRSACLGIIRIYDKNKNMVYLKYQAPTDDLVNKKIDPTTAPKVQHKINTENKFKKINVFNKENELLGTYTSKGEVARIYKVSHTTVANQCNGIIAYSRNPYIFKYADIHQ